MLNGYKTFIGAAYTLGAILFPFIKEYISEDEVSTAAVLINSLIGLGMVVYGRVKAKKTY